MQIGTYKQRKLVFQGNSLSNDNTNNALVNGHFIPMSVYNSLMSAGNYLAMYSFAISGQRQSQINTLFSTKEALTLAKNDILVIWEGTNDIGGNQISGEAAISNLISYLAMVAPYQVKVVVGTVTARDVTTDPSDLLDRIGVYNTWVRANESAYNYTMWDIGAHPLFDTRGDCSNTTYYKGDKIHHTTAGQNIMIPLLTSVIAGII